MAKKEFGIFANFFVNKIHSNELTALARYDGVQRQIERIQELKQDKER